MENVAQLLPFLFLVPLFLLLLAALGRIVGGKNGAAGADVFCGWGVSVALLVPFGIFMKGHLSWAIAALGLASLLALFITMRSRQTKYLYAGLSAALLSQLWVMYFIFKQGINGWDDISHWMLNALYLWHHDAFPSQTLGAVIYSVWPGYPQAMPLLHNMVAHLGGVFALSSGAALVWGLHTLMALWLSQTPALAKTLLGRVTGFFFALAFLTILNPGYNASFTLTGQSDGPTTLLVGAVGLLFALLYESLKRQDTKRTNALSVQLALCALVLVSLRQANLLFLLMMSGAFGLLLVRDAIQKTGDSVALIKRAVLRLLPMLALAIGFFLLWKGFADTHLPRTGFEIKPLEQWRWDLGSQMIHAVGKEILKKNGYFLLLFGVSLYGGFAFFKRKDVLGTLAFMTLVLCLGHLSFLLLAYMGSSFCEAEITRAASFYRYMVHLDLMPTLVVWLALRAWLEPKATKRKTIALLVFSVLLLPTIYAVKGKWLIPHSDAQLCEDRHAWQGVASHLPPQSNLVFLAAQNSDLSNIVINLELGIDDARRGSASRHVFAQTIAEALATPRKDSVLENKENNAVYILEPNAAILKRLGVTPPAPLPRRLLLLREKDSWHVVETADN